MEDRYDTFISIARSKGNLKELLKEFEKPLPEGALKLDRHENYSYCFRSLFTAEEIASRQFTLDLYWIEHKDEATMYCTYSWARPVEAFKRLQARRGIKLYNQTQPGIRIKVGA